MSALLKQKSKVGVLMKPRKTYDSYDFMPEKRKNYHLEEIKQPSPSPQPKERVIEVIGPKKIQAKMVEKYDGDAIMKK